MSQNDQQIALAMSKITPSIQLESKLSLFSLPRINNNNPFVGINCEFSNFGPLINAIATAPATHKIVPITFAILLKLFICTFSNLIFFFIKKKYK